MGIESIENVVREPITVELSEDYNVKWTKEKIQFPDAKYSFELYKGVEDGGSLVFFIKEIRDNLDTGYLLDVKLSFDFGDNEDDFALLSETYHVETIEQGFVLSEKINKAFARLYEKSE